MKDADPVGRGAPSDLDTARRRLALGVLVCAIAALFVFVVFRPFRRADTVLNVSYDAAREFYAEVNEVFVRQSGAGVTHVEMSHAGSTAQAQALIRGLMADVATLATAADVDAISRAGLVSPEWRERYPHGASPYASTIVFLVRAGNPKQIRDWDDLERDGVIPVSPDPRSSGAGRWAYLSAWGAVITKGGDARDAERRVWSIFWKARLVNDGARGVLERFERTDEGDVLLTWESEAHRAVARFGSERFAVVYPSVSILAEPVAAVVDRYVNRRGTRASAEAYLEFLFSREGQELAARNFLRPRMEDVAREHPLPPVELFTIDEVFGGWEKALEAHFAAGGTFDHLARSRQLQRAE